MRTTNRFGVSFERGDIAQAVDYKVVHVTLKRIRPTTCDGCGATIAIGDLYGTRYRREHYCLDELDRDLETPAAVRFLSCEPLLGPVDLQRFMHRPDCGCLGCFNVTRGTVPDQRLHWVIAGGESGPGARRVAAGVPFFFKQWGAWSPDPTSKSKPDAMVLGDGRAIGPHEEVWAADTLDAIPMANVGKKQAGRTLDGRTWDEMPERVL